MIILLMIPSVNFSQTSVKQKKQLTRILFLFDASQSMYARWETNTKFEIAKKLLSEMVDSLQPIDDLELAMRVYGHTKKYPPQDCDDTRLEVSFGKQNGYQIKKRLSSVYARDFKPMLCHGNLHPSNVIVQSSGEIWVIDWGTASGNYVPYAELTDLFTWNTGKENIRCFCDGYGISPEELHDMMYDIQTLVLLRLLTVLLLNIEKVKDSSMSEFATSTIKTINEIEDFEGETLFLKNL